MKRILRILTPFAILIVMLALTERAAVKKLRSLFRNRRGFCAPILRRNPLLRA